LDGRLRTDLQEIALAENHPSSGASVAKDAADTTAPTAFEATSISSPLGCEAYLRFSFGQSPLQQFYTPIYARSAAGGAFNKTDKYQLLYAAGVSTGIEVASEADVQVGTTLASRGKQIPLALSAAAQVRGLDVLYRGPKQKYVDARRTRTYRMSCTEATS
jgi:hypothetical protein